MARSASQSTLYEPLYRRRLPPEVRREQLLQCALRVFARRGIGAAHHAEIAAEAGVSVPTVFVYFTTRDALVDAVLDEVARFYIALAEHVHASRRPAPEVVTAHAMAFSRSIDGHPDYASVLLNWSSAVRTEHWPRYRAMESRVLALLARTFARGQRQNSVVRVITAEDAARMTYGAAYLLAQQKLSGQPQADISRFFDAIMRVLASTVLGGPHEALAGPKAKKKPRPANNLTV
jgi:TetR/AcrR family hemagglutinin/protease transcriptional regulator